MREESTSYHYISEGNEIVVNETTLPLMIDFFKQKDIHYTVGKVWTTDAIYRETQDKVERMKAKGCLCVDMECSAISSLALFRHKKVMQFFYSADCLDNEYDIRSLRNEEKIDVKRKTVDLAILLALSLEKE